MLRLLAIAALGLTAHGSGARSMRFIATVDSSINGAADVERLGDDTRIASARVWTSGMPGGNADESARVLLVGNRGPPVFAWDGLALGLDTDARLALWLPEGDTMLAEK